MKALLWIFTVSLLIPSSRACWRDAVPQLPPAETNPAAPFPGASQECYNNVQDGVQGFCIQDNCCNGGKVKSNLCADYAYNVKCCFSSNACGAECGACSDATAKEYACKMLAMSEQGQIYLKSNHFDPLGNTPYDGASVLSNIRDTCYGKQAKRSSYKNGKGGCFCLQGTMLKNLHEYASKFWTDRSKAIMVNSLVGGSHSINSTHYYGITFDIGCTLPVNHCTDIVNFCKAKNAKHPICYPGGPCTGHKTWVHCAF